MRKLRIITFEIKFAEVDNMKKRDLLLLCQYFYPDAVSTGRLPTELAEDLVKHGMSVDVLCGYPSYITFGDDARKVPKEEKYKGISIKRLKYPNFKKNSKFGRLLNYFSFSFLVLGNIFSFKKYKKVLLISNPPMLPYFGYVSKKLFKNKFVYLIYDLYPDIAVALGAVGKSSIMVKVMNHINKKVFETADSIIVLGEDMKKYLEENKELKNNNTIRVIPNWVDKEKIKIKDKVNKFSVDESLDNKFVVLYSGNIGLFQDLEMLIEVANKLRIYDDIVFVFVGNGGKKWKLIDMASEYKLSNVKFYDFQPDEIYEEVLASADCLVVTLERCAEGLGVPSKTYTYLAAGRPLVGIMSDKTDIGLMIENEDIGYRVDQTDIEKLYEGILFLYNNICMREEMGQKARILFEKQFERGVITKKYYNIFKNL